MDKDFLIEVFMTILFCTIVILGVGLIVWGFMDLIEVLTCQSNCGLTKPR